MVEVQQEKIYGQRACRQNKCAAEKNPGTRTAADGEIESTIFAREKIGMPQISD